MKQTETKKPHYHARNPMGLVLARELAKIVGVSQDKINYWRHWKGLPFHRVGPKAYLYSPAEVQEWIDNGNPK